MPPLTETSHSQANRDHSQDQEAARDATLAKTITEAVAQQSQSITEMFAKQNREAAKETQSIAEMFAQQNREAAKEMQSMAKAFTRQMEKAHVQYQELLKETRAAILPTTLKVTSSTDSFRVMDSFDWTLDKMSTRDGNFGHTRLDSHLKQWREILRKPRFLTCTIGLMVKTFPKLKDGKTARLSSVRKTMTN